MGDRAFRDLSAAGSQFAWSELSCDFIQVLDNPNVV